MEIWHYNGVSLNTPAWKVEEVPDGLGVPSLRGDNIQVPFSNGKRSIKKMYDDRTIMLNMWVLGRDMVTGKLSTVNTEAEELVKNIDYLCKLFGKKGVYELKRSFELGERPRIAMAEVYNQVIFKKISNGAARLSVEFLLADPFFYSDLGRIGVCYEQITSSSFDTTVNITGTAFTTDMDLILIGPLEHPKIENLNNNIWLQYNGSIGAGEMVIIDTKDFTCMKSGENMLSALKHGGDPYWFMLEAGDNAIRVTSTASGGYLQIGARSAYF